MDAEMRASIDEIKAHHPLHEIAPRYAELKRSGDRLIGRCPFHDDRRPSFSVHLRTQTWQCFAASCELGGDVIDLIGYTLYGRAWNSRDKNMFKEALRQLEGRTLPPLRHPIPTTWQTPALWRPVELTPRTQMLLHTAARLYHTTLLAMGQGLGTPYAYLRGRGFTDETIRREAIGYATGDLLGPALAACGLSRAMAAEINLLDAAHHHREFMGGRIVFVERDRMGRILHLIGRAFAPWIHADAPKYLSLKEMAKPLYGYARLDKRPSDNPVVLVESPPDAITARQWDFDALANVGTKMKEEHVALLQRLRRPLAIVPHNDAGIGLEAAERWQERIGQGKIILLPDEVKDLNELGTKEKGEAEFVFLMRAAGFERELKHRSSERPAHKYENEQVMVWATEGLLSSHF